MPKIISAAESLIDIVATRKLIKIINSDMQDKGIKRNPKLGIQYTTLIGYLSLVCSSPTLENIDNAHHAINWFEKYNADIKNYIKASGQLTAMLKNMGGRVDYKISHNFELQSKQNPLIEFNQEMIKKFFNDSNDNQQWDNISYTMKKYPNKLANVLNKENIKHMYLVAQENFNYNIYTVDELVNFLKKQQWSGETNVYVFSVLKQELAVNFKSYLMSKHGRLCILELLNTLISSENNTDEIYKTNQNLFIELIQDNEVRKKANLPADKLLLWAKHSNFDPIVCKELVKDNEIYKKMRIGTNNPILIELEGNSYFQAYYAINRGIEQSRGGILGIYKQKSKNYLNDFINNGDINDPQYNIRCAVVAGNEDYWKHISIKPESSGWFFGLIGKRTKEMVLEEKIALARKSVHFAEKIFCFKDLAPFELFKLWVNKFNSEGDGSIQKKIEEYIKNALANKKDFWDILSAIEKLPPYIKDKQIGLITELQKNRNICTKDIDDKIHSMIELQRMRITSEIDAVCLPPVNGNNPMLLGNGTKQIYKKIKNDDTECLIANREKTNSDKEDYDTKRDCTEKNHTVASVPNRTNLDAEPVYSKTQAKMAAR